jgi:hypothetical protein
MSSNSFYKVDEINSDTLIVSFSGNALMYGGIPKFEFVHFFEKNFNDVNRHFYVDTNLSSYHKGIPEISNNIDETKEYLQKEIEKYKRVIFIGASSGGYAAILFGSLLNVTYVLAFIPQTILHSQDRDEKYRDISRYINNKTKYYLCGDLSVENPSDCHHISHCERISCHKNVFIKKCQSVNVKEMRDSGELYTILKILVYGK